MKQSALLANNIWVKILQSSLSYSIKREWNTVIQSREQPTYLNVNDNNYWPEENLLVQLKYFANILGRISVGLAVLAVKSFYQG